MSFFAQLRDSFTSLTFFKRVKKQKFKHTISFYALLILIVTLIVTTLTTFEIIGFAKDLENTIPTITISAGVVTTDVQQPYTAITGGELLIIDTTGKITSLNNVEGGVLLTKNRLIIKESILETREFDLSTVGDITIDKALISRLSTTITAILVPIMLIGIYLGLFLFYAGYVLFFSLIPLIVNHFTRRNLKYEQMVTLGVYSLTLPFLVLVILSLLNIEVSFLFTGIYLIVLITVLVKK